MKRPLPNSWQRWRKARMADLILDGMTAEMASTAASAEAHARWLAAIKVGKRSAMQATVEFTDEGGAIVRGSTENADPTRLRRTIMRNTIPIY